MPNVNTVISSNHKFTDPIRLFKGNDPYHFQVDNIPIEQLQENCRWLKDQILNFNVEITDVGRTSLSELKPYVSGSDRVVKVSPGRFSARVNDAHDVSSLQDFSLDSLNDFWNGTSRAFKSSVDDVSAVTQVISSLLSGNGAGKVLINGLETRAIDWLYDFPSSQFPPHIVNSPQVGNLTWSDYQDLPDENIWPLQGVKFLTKGLQGTITIAGLGGSLGKRLQTLSYEFVRKWRGVARMAIVDVPNELSISIPPFSDDDYFSIGADGEITPTEGTVRIDLLFIYTKPIDAESTSLPAGNTYRTITTPELGIVKGAGLGFHDDGTQTIKIVNRDSVEATTFYDEETGNYKLLPDVDSEKFYKTSGFSEGPLNPISIKGTFPSPDDLLNLAPQLLENLQSTDVRLIGQSVLPIAYIVTTKPTDTDTVNATGQYPLTSTSIIDIRPFFRTAELTYNERAGIAGASPQLSFANPAVGKAELQQAIIDVRDSILSIPEEKESAVLAKGTIHGGILYGPEGSLLKEGGLSWSQVHNSDGSLTEAAKRVLSPSTFNEKVKVPVFPQWELAWHCAAKSDAGSYVNDWSDEEYIVNTPGVPNPITSVNTLDHFPFGLDEDIREELGLVKDLVHPDAAPGLPGMSWGYMLRFSRKTFYLENIPDWVNDVSLTLNYSNCMPLYSDGVAPSIGGLSYGRSAIYGPGEIGAEYGPNVAFSTRSCKIEVVTWSAGRSGRDVPAAEHQVSQSRNNIEIYSYLATGTLASNGRVRINKCVYPTVDFTIVGTNLARSSGAQTAFGIMPGDLPQENQSLTNSERKTLLAYDYKNRTKSIKTE